MNIQDLLETVTPEIYENLKRSIELGKWPNGQKLTKEQKENSLQLVIAYEQEHFPEQERTGYVPPKAACGSKKTESKPEEPAPLKWS
ncbi:YeaC family protein [Sessilibacter corallicola]|uniref:YeaC family protein n=1 Tax=Sessilibacter corallicola TaxID=2904075 RepID=A0ABQ0ADL1_9GAMM|nr:DUF1315 family protein [Sessilibacter corallicola]MCE2029897.1 YeaC family protein [Sessilibacter corallicola]